LLQAALDRLVALRPRLCPRQVLGVRIGLLGGSHLGLELPQVNKRLLVFMETDGCAADGVTAGTGCRLGRRTMRIMDFGKVAATFADTETGLAVRVAPKAGIREAAQRYAPEAGSRWEAQLAGYRIMPTTELLRIQQVTLTVDLEKLISRPGLRVTCEACGEEIMNEREVFHEGMLLCQSCHGHSYYRPALGPDKFPASSSA
jgi:formylmethanofuran dehydrogenase subunit E